MTIMGIVVKLLKALGQVLYKETLCGPALNVG